MDKRPRKLKLHKETLRCLDDAGLLRVLAGAGTSLGCTQHTFCNTDCPYCPTQYRTKATEFTVCTC